MNDSPFEIQLAYVETKEIEQLCNDNGYYFQNLTAQEITKLSRLREAEIKDLNNLQTKLQSIGKNFENNPVAQCSRNRIAEYEDRIKALRIQSPEIKVGCFLKNLANENLIPSTDKEDFVKLLMFNLQKLFESALIGVKMRVQSFNVTSDAIFLDLVLLP